MSAPTFECYSYKNMSATANVSPRPCVLGGIFCASSSSGTAAVYDSATTGTGTIIANTFSLTAGTYYPLPFATLNGLYIVIGGTADITVGTAAA